MVDRGIADTIALKATQFIARHKDEPFFSSIWEPTTCMCRVFIPALRAKRRPWDPRRRDPAARLDDRRGDAHVGQPRHRRQYAIGFSPPTTVPRSTTAIRTGGHAAWRAYAPQASTAARHSLTKPERAFLSSCGGLLCETGRAVRRLLADRRLPLARNADRRRPFPSWSCPRQPQPPAWLLGMGHSDREYVIEQNRQNTLAIRCGEWKYLEPSDRQSYEYRKSVELGNSPRPQLFCISKDPCERHDVAEQYPEIVEELATKT